MDEVDKTNRVSVKYYRDQDVGILFKFVKYDHGYVFKFINDSNQFRLKETMIFNLENCYVVGERGNVVNFVLDPKSIRLIHIVPINPSFQYRADLVDERSDVFPL